MTDQSKSYGTNAAPVHSTVLPEIGVAVSESEIQTHPNSIGAILAEKSHEVGIGADGSSSATAANAGSKSAAQTQSLTSGNSLTPSDDLTTSHTGSTPANTMNSAGDLSAKSPVQKASEIVSSVSGNVSSVRDKIGEKASSNGVVLALGAAAAGMIVGSLLPVSEVEKERTAELGRRLADTAKAQAQVAVGKSKSALTDAVAQATSRADAVKKQAQAA